MVDDAPKGKLELSAPLPQESPSAPEDNLPSMDRPETVPSKEKKLAENKANQADLNDYVNHPDDPDDLDAAPNANFQQKMNQRAEAAQIEKGEAPPAFPGGVSVSHTDTVEQNPQQHSGAPERVVKSKLDMCVPISQTFNVSVCGSVAGEENANKQAKDMTLRHGAAALAEGLVTAVTGDSGAGKVAGVVAVAATRSLEVAQNGLSGASIGMTLKVGF